MNDQLVSVVLPVYNGERYLEEAIGSVLKQSYHSLEILVIDDGSEDNTKDIIHSFQDTRIKYFYQTNQGQTTALNLGVHEATGKYLAFIDADDLWHHRKLEIQKDFLDTNSYCDLLFSHLSHFISPELSSSEKQKILIPKATQPGLSRLTLFCLLKTFKRIGTLSTAFAVGEFIEWFGRAQGMNQNVSTLDAVLAFRRIHKSNMGIVKADKRAEFARIMKATLDRRRAKSS